MTFSLKLLAVNATRLYDSGCTVEDVIANYDADLAMLRLLSAELAERETSLALPCGL